MAEVECIGENLLVHPKPTGSRPPQDRVAKNPDAKQEKEPQLFSL